MISRWMGVGEFAEDEFVEDEGLDWIECDLSRNFDLQAKDCQLTDVRVSASRGTSLTIVVQTLKAAWELRVMGLQGKVVLPRTRGAVMYTL
jgi:hypothetical protein